MTRARHRPLKAMFFLADTDGGGAQRTVVNLVNTFPSAEIEATLVVGRADGPARGWLRPGRRLLVLGVPRARAALGPLRRAIRAERPDVLFATMVDANILAAAATVGLSRRPALVLRETNPHRSRDDLGILRRRAIRWAYLRADRVVALSTGVGRELVEDYGLDPAKVTTIHNPVDVEAFAAQAEAARRSAPPWGDWAAGGAVLIGAGRLTRQKGFDLLLRALARIGDRTVRLVLLGDGPERTALEALVAELGLGARVSLPGFVDDPAAWLAHADLFVLSSRWEGFGHAIVEAMACGLPVLATDCPHGPAEIITDGLDGRLVSPDDPSALAEGITALLAAPAERSRLAVAGARTTKRFACHRIAEEYAALLSEVAGP